MLKKLFLHKTDRGFVQLVRYGMVVAIAGPIDLGGYIVLKHFIHYVLAATISFSVSLLVNYLLSIAWVWTNHTGRRRNVDAAVFAFVGLVGLALTDLVVYGLTEFAHFDAVVSKLCALIVVFFWSFGARHYLFTNKFMQDEASAKDNPTKQSILGRLIGFVRSPVFIVYVLCLVLFLFNLARTYRLRPFNSDDVFWQAILQTWHPLSGNLVTLGNSSIYVDKIPYYEFFSHFFGYGRRVLFMEAALAALLGFSLFYWSCVFFLRKLSNKLNYLALLPFVWLSSFGYAFTQLYLNSNWRGFQIGVSFATFALVAAFWYKDIALRSFWSKCLLVLACVYGGLQLYSDPYFLYFTLGPIALFSLLLLVIKKITTKQALVIFGAVVLSVVFAKAFAELGRHYGVRIAAGYPMQFTQFDNVGSSFSGSLHSILIIFNADFFGHALRLGTLGLLLNFTLLCFVIYKVYTLLKATGKDGGQALNFGNLWQLFFVGICLLIFITHTFSTLGLGTATYRYFLLFALLLIFALSVAINGLEHRLSKMIVAAVLMLSVVLNIGVPVLSDNEQFEIADNRANTVQLQVIDMLRARGYTKGYANYWDANISTYLSGSTIAFLPSICSGHETQRWYWLINNNAFDRHADRSFYYVNPNTPATCAIGDIEQQLGPAEASLYIGNKTVLLYDHDITSQLPAAL